MQRVWISTKNYKACQKERNREQKQASKPRLDVIEMLVIKQKMQITIINMLRTLVGKVENKKKIQREKNSKTNKTDQP